MTDTLKQYKSIAPCLLTIEELIYGSATGKCQEMVPFYFFWECAIFKAINQMVLTGVQELLAAIGQKAKSQHQKDTHVKVKRHPMFKVRDAGAPA